MSDLIKCWEASAPGLETKSNVIGTGTGFKITAGQETGEEAILVFVDRKQPIGYLPSQDDLIPSQIDGLPVDVIEIGEVTAPPPFPGGFGAASGTYTGKMRPIQPGCSIGHFQSTAGTLGGIFRDSDGDLVALSNCHVVAQEGHGRPGDRVLQPGPIDDGTEQFGCLKRFGGLQRNIPNRHDSGTVKIDPNFINQVNYNYIGINKVLSGFGSISPGQSVSKVGRTTGHTSGKVISTNAVITVGYGAGPLKFANCIVTNAMSQGGDSGSILFNPANMQAVGLLFGGSNQVTLFNHISEVVGFYGLKLA